MKTRFPILAAAFVFVATGVQTACAYPLSDVSVINRTTGERLKTYRHKGQLWVAGKPFASPRSLGTTPPWRC